MRRVGDNAPYHFVIIHKVLQLALEIARVRKANDECSTWMPIDTNFFERKSYGTVILDFSWTK